MQTEPHLKTGDLFQPTNPWVYLYFVVTLQFSNSMDSYKDSFKRFDFFLNFFFITTLNKMNKFLETYLNDTLNHRSET